MTDPAPRAAAAPDPVQEGPGASPLTADDLRDRPHLADALRLARAWGVAPTAFLGHSRWSRTSYTYDELGRIRDAYVEVPGWTDADRDAAIALAELEAGQCGGCGGELAETTAKGRDYAYEAVAATCHRCAALQREAGNYGEHPTPAALQYTVAFHPDRVIDLPGGGEPAPDG